MWFAVDQRGVHLLEFRTRNVLTSYEYDSILDYTPSLNHMLLITGSDKKQSKIIVTTNQVNAFRWNTYFLLILAKKFFLSVWFMNFYHFFHHRHSKYQTLSENTSKFTISIAHLMRMLQETCKVSMDREFRPCINTNRLNDKTQMKICTWCMQQPPKICKFMRLARFKDLLLFYTSNPQLS